ncbi:hypothetical protein NDU88_002911 [Pleurodeles waltl]|uniref:Uncharacterized protein n=1 Tax=Pleurodeles waltl TaxID=8319 RepID=A0AAV7LDQ2_PLEWA|nr:hypothetical protein NDU88_002911 [Pleurodeles waltl]
MGTRLAFPPNVPGVLAAFGAIKKSQALRAAPPEPPEVSVSTKQGSGHPWRARAATNQAMRHTVLPMAQSAPRRKTGGRAAHHPSNAPAPQKQSKVWAHGMRSRDVEAAVAAVIERAERLIRISRNSRPPS